MMTIPGLALFYGGMVRVTNVLSTLMQVCVCMYNVCMYVVRAARCGVYSRPHLVASGEVCSRDQCAQHSHAGLCLYNVCMYVCMRVTNVLSTLMQVCACLMYVCMYV